MNNGVFSQYHYRLVVVPDKLGIDLTNFQALWLQPDYQREYKHSFSNSPF
jgi:hypothetical protein